MFDIKVHVDSISCFYPFKIGSMKKIFEQSKWGRDRTLSRTKEKEVTLEVVVVHKEELLSKLEMEEKSFAVKKESIQRNLVEIEKHEIVLRFGDGENKNLTCKILFYVGRRKLLKGKRKTMKQGKEVKQIMKR